jgi:hypothetical protein
MRLAGRLSLENIGGLFEKFWRRKNIHRKAQDFKIAKRNQCEERRSAALRSSTTLYVPKLNSNES